MTNRDHLSTCVRCFKSDAINMTFVIETSEGEPLFTPIQAKVCKGCRYEINAVMRFLGYQAAGVVGRQESAVATVEDEGGSKGGEETKSRGRRRA